MKKPDFEVNCGFCGKLFTVKRKSYLDQIRRDENHIFYCSQECRLAKQKTGQIINCLTCGKEVYKAARELKRGARFCSTSCSALFNNQLRVDSNFESNKGKTKLLNCSSCNKEYIGSVHTPISTGLCEECKSSRKIIESNCIDCDVVIYGSYDMKYCDPCRSRNNSVRIQSRIDNGLIFSKSIKCEYLFNDKVIRCDSKLEYVCLLYFQTQFDVLDMNRSQLKLQYILDDKIRNYFPDFEIILKDGNKYLIECKGVVGKKLNDKWNDYNRKSIEKKKVLEKWCQENGYISFWFNQQQHDYLYKKTKINAVIV